MVSITVKDKPQEFQAFQWDGEPLPYIGTCSCHPGQGTLDGGLSWVRKGDWILIGTSNGVTKGITDEVFKQDYELTVI